MRSSGRRPSPARAPTARRLCSATATARADDRRPEHILRRGGLGGVEIRLAERLQKKPAHPFRLELTHRRRRGAGASSCPAASWPRDASPSRPGTASSARACARRGGRRRAAPRPRSRARGCGLARSSWAIARRIGPARATTRRFWFWSAPRPRRRRPPRPASPTCSRADHQGRSNARREARSRRAATRTDRVTRRPVRALVTAHGRVAGAIVRALDVARGRPAASCA